MKLRLHSDSIRLRISQAEAMQLGSGETLRSATRFASGSLEIVLAAGGGAQIEARFENGRITVDVPAAQAREWSGNEVEGLYSTSGPCQVAIEKDYACLHKTGDANLGTFPNPAAL